MKRAEKQIPRAKLKAMADLFAEQHPTWGRTTLYHAWHSHPGVPAIPIRLFRSLDDPREGAGQQLAKRVQPCPTRGARRKSVASGLSLKKSGVGRKVPNP